MGIFFVHILKSAACLIVFYSFFRLLLNRDTFHHFNRIAVLCILVLSLVVPFCSIHVNAPTQINRSVSELHRLFVEPDSVAVVAQPDKPLTWTHAVLLVYLAGILFFVCRDIYFLMRIRRLLQQNRMEKLDNGAKLVVCSHSVPPFSWMNYIVIFEDDLKENGKEIITHEMAHVRKHHSIDILLTDICTVFQWFNPAIWLIRQELQNIHEYEADEYVLKEGIDAKQYQLLLIKKAVGKRLYSIDNSFNHSKLKKRITMMSKQKSSPWARLKYLYVLPVTVVAITAFANPEVSSELDKVSKVKVNDFAEMAKINNGVKNNLPVSGTVEASAKTNIPKDKSDKEVVEKRISGIVTDSSGNPIAGAAVVVTGSTKGTVTDKDGKFVLDVPDDAGLSVYMAGMESVTVKSVGNEKSLVITLNPEDSDQNTNAVDNSSTEDNTTSIKDAIPLNESKQPLIVIDGKVGLNINDVKPNDIVNFKILQSEEAVKQYGADGKNGAIMLTTKNKN